MTNMTILSTVFFSLMFSTGISALPRNPRNVSLRIAGGRDANTGEFPWNVSLRRTSERIHFCAGTVLDDYHVLTAANCIYRTDITTVVVVSGSISLLGNEYFETLGQEKFVHPYFNPSTSENDIAIFRVIDAFEINGVNVGSVLLSKQLPEPGFTVKVAGWGLSANNEKPQSEVLQIVELKHVTMNECKLKFAKDSSKGIKLTAGMFCALSLEGKDTCIGDSGGAAMYGLLQVGIVSWGHDVCGSPEFPSVYTSVPYYRRWIQEALLYSYGKKLAGRNGSHIPSLRLSLNAIPIMYLLVY